MQLFIKCYLYLFLCFFIFFTYFLASYYDNFVYNYLLIIHISLIITSYILFFISLILNIYSLYITINLNINNFLSILGIYYSLLTITIGSLWAFSIWKSFLFYDIRILLIILLFLYFYTNLHIFTINLYYKILFFFFCIVHLLLFRIKNNWSSQIHQSNSFLFFLYHLPIIDSYYFSISIILIISYTFNMLLMNKYLTISKQYS